MNGRKVHVQKFYVSDELTYETVVEFEYEGTVREFTSVEGYQGNTSPEWGARILENQAEAKARQAKAEAEAKRLNEKWSVEGYPVG